MVQKRIMPRLIGPDRLGGPGRSGASRRKAPPLAAPAGEARQPWRRCLDCALTAVERAEKLAADVSGVLVLGMGGSALATRALAALLPGRVPVVVLDHLDPQLLSAQLSFALHPGTRLVVVSKSGNTLETVLQYRFFRAAGVPADRFLFVGDPVKGWLQDEAKRIGAKPFKVARELGGRFSVFSPVALVPLTLAGVDTRGLLKGAAAALPQLGSASGIEQDVLRARDLILVTYRNELAPLAFWLQQLWAESLGKRLADGSPSPFPLPVWCEGPRDQHALFQMFLEGDPARVFLFLDLEDGVPGPAVDLKGMESLLPGVRSPLSLGHALRACREGTAEAIAARGLPVYRWVLPRTPAALAGFMAWGLDRTYRFARALGVDPHGQPAVEEGKRRTREILRKTARVGGASSRKG